MIDPSISVRNSHIDSLRSMIYIGQSRIKLKLKFGGIGSNLGGINKEFWHAMIRCLPGLGVAGFGVRGARSVLRVTGYGLRVACIEDRLC